MPYTTIYWIKLEKRLLNDHRFYILSDQAQLIYVKMLMLAAETGNKIPKNPVILQSCFRSRITPEEIESCIKEIMTNFPKFIHSNEFYKFKEWSTRTNWVVAKELRRNSNGTPMELQNRIEKNRIDKIIEEYIRRKGFTTILPDGSKDKELINAIYKRNCRPARDLALLTKDDNQIIEAINWFADICDKKDLTWALETILKWFPEYLLKGKTNSYDKLLEKAGLKKKGQK